jgi:hypothetical protein
MKIQRMSFRGVPGLPDLTIDLTDPRTGAPHPLVVLSGPSGSGKTRIIDALIAAKEAMAPYGQPTLPAPWIGRGSNATKIVIAFHLDETERGFAGNAASATSVLEGEVIFSAERANAYTDDGLRALLRRYSHNPAYGKVEYFSAERKIPVVPPAMRPSVADQCAARLGKDPRKYGALFPFLQGLGQDPARRDRFSASLEALSATCRYKDVGTEDAVPRCFSSAEGAPVTVGELSQAEADAVLIAGTAALIGLDHSLIFIDRPDLHIDALDRLVTGLSSLGEDNQLILTGGPSLAAAAPDAHVVHLTM